MACSSWRSVHSVSRGRDCPENTLLRHASGAHRAAARPPGVDMDETHNEALDRLSFLASMAVGAIGAALPGMSHSAETLESRGVEEASPPGVDVVLHVNGDAARLRLDPRVTLLDALREHLRLTGTKKGC